MPMYLLDMEEEAKSLGFPNSREMLVTMYVARRMTIRQIADKLGFHYVTIKRRLEMNGVEMRPRGRAVITSGPRSAERRLLREEHTIVEGQYEEDEG